MNTITKELTWISYSDEDNSDFEGYYAAVKGEDGETIAEYNIKIYRGKGHLYAQRWMKREDGSWPRYGDYFDIDEARWDFKKVKDLINKHFQENFTFVEHGK